MPFCRKTDCYEPTCKGNFLTRVGWKVHRRTKEKLCHSNETWHALNSTFPDTNCIMSFQINPHWISNSGLWEVVLETFQKRPGKLSKGVLFHQDNAPAHKPVVAMAVVRDCGFELVDHPPYSPDLAPSIFCSPTWKKQNTWLGSSIVLVMRSYLQLRTFFWGSRWELLYHGNPSTATPMEEVCGPHRKLCWKNGCGSLFRRLVTPKVRYSEHIHFVYLEVR